MLAVHARCPALFATLLKLVAHDNRCPRSLPSMPKAAHFSHADCCYASCCSPKLRSAGQGLIATSISACQHGFSFFRCCCCNFAAATTEETTDPMPQKQLQQPPHSLSRPAWHAANAARRTVCSLPMLHSGCLHYLMPTLLEMLATYAAPYPPR